LGYQKRKNARHLEDKVDGGQWPVVLGSKKQVYNQNACKSQNDTDEEDLDGKRSGERWLVIEDRVCVITPVVG
jgi:hypothetical protein